MVQNKIKEFAVLFRVGAISVAVRGVTRPIALRRPGSMEQRCREANGCDWIPHRQEGRRIGWSHLDWSGGWIKQFFLQKLKGTLVMFYLTIDWNWFKNRKKNIIISYKRWKKCSLLWRCREVHNLVKSTKLANRGTTLRDQESLEGRNLHELLLSDHAGRL